MELWVDAIRVFYHTTNVEARTEANDLLCKLERQNDAWQILAQILSDSEEEEVLCFAAMAIRNKVKFAFGVLPREAYRSFPETVFLLMRRHNTRKRVLAYLSLAMADFMFLACRHLEHNPITQIFSFWGSEIAVPNASDTLILLRLLTDVAEEFMFLSVDSETHRCFTVMMESAQDSVAKVCQTVLSQPCQPQTRTTVLSCWASWLSSMPGHLAEQSGIFFSEVFKILSGEAGETYEDRGGLEETLTECLVSVIDITDEGFRCWSSVENDLKVIEFIGLNCGGSKIIEKVYRDLEIGDELSVSYLTRLLGSVLKTKFLKSGDVDDTNCPIYWRNILDIFINLIKNTNYEELYSQKDFPIYLKDVLYLWHKLSSSHNRQILTPAFTHLLSVLSGVVVLPPNPPRYARSHRNKFIEVFGDCAHFFGLDVVVSYLINLLRESGGGPREQEAVFSALTELLSDCDVSETEEAKANERLECFMEQFATGSILAAIAPPDDVAVSLRIGALNLICSCRFALKNQRKLLGPLLEKTLTQTQQWNPPIPKLTIAASAAFRHLCVSHADSIEGADLVSPLAAVFRARFADKAEFAEEREDVLLGFVELAGGGPDDGKLMEVLELIFQALFSHLQNPEGEDQFILDRLATTLKVASEMTRKSKQRMSVMSVFVLGKLFEVIKHLLTVHQENPFVVEKTIRCLKHAIRAIGPRFVPMLPNLIPTISAGFERNLHSSYLYCAEFLLKEGMHQPSAIPVIQELFQQLGDLAFDKIKIFPLQHPHDWKLKIHQLGEFCEDAYGMVLRFLQLYPSIPLQSGVLAKAIECAQWIIQHQSYRPFDICCCFLELVLNPNAASRDQERPSPEVLRALQGVSATATQTIIKPVFVVISGTPNDHFLARLASVIYEAHKLNRDEAQRLCREAMREFPEGLLTPEYESEILSLLSSHWRNCEKGVRELSDRLGDFKRRVG